MSIIILLNNIVIKKFYPRKKYKGKLYQNLYVKKHWKNSDKKMIYVRKRTRDILW